MTEAISAALALQLRFGYFYQPKMRAMFSTKIDNRKHFFKIIYN